MSTRQKLIVCFCISVCLVFTSTLLWAANYAVAKKAVPVFNTPDFISLYKIDDKRREQLKDNCYHMKELEFIALPKTSFEVIDKFINNGVTVLRVETKDYPYPSSDGYYIDGRYVKETNEKPDGKKHKVLSKKKIIKRMKDMVGYRYTWGGNYHNGLQKVPSDYISNEDTDMIKERLLFKGVDCSGLLYEATGAYTPRNTSGLVKFGEPVEIAGKSVDKIIEQIEPLDIIVWRGHTMIILDNENLIESREDYEKDIEGCQGGVRIRPLKVVLNEVLTDRVAVNDYDDEAPVKKKKFVIRRWFNSNN